MRLVLVMWVRLSRGVRPVGYSCCFRCHDLSSVCLKLTSVSLFVLHHVAKSMSFSFVLFCLTPWRPLLPYGYSYKASHTRPSFVIFDIPALWRSVLSVRVPWASECPDVKNYKWRLNPVNSGRQWWGTSNQRWGSRDSPGSPNLLT